MIKFSFFNLVSDSWKSGAVPINLRERGLISISDSPKLQRRTSDWILVTLKEIEAFTSVFAKARQHSGKNNSC